MAQKAAKTTAKRNTTVLNRTHLLSLIPHTVYLLLRVLIFRRSFTRTSLLLYLLLCAPAFAIQFLLERNSRPKYTTSSSSSGTASGAGAGTEQLRSAGEDVDAKGLTEWMWDVLYWTWGCVALAGVFGDRAWWVWVAVPVYSAWLAWSTFGSVRKGLSGMGMGSGAGAQGAGDAGQGMGGQAGSKRQQKMEKRGGQRVQYR